MDEFEAFEPKTFVKRLLGESYPSNVMDHFPVVSFCLIKLENCNDVRFRKLFHSLLGCRK